ncbi:MAG TPA: hypothetical protein VLG66_09325 [Alphaproteobacteria bacterium]|nr:hypothetical protein [Alphaproteobacteria bacterium]
MTISHSLAKGMASEEGAPPSMGIAHSKAKAQAIDTPGLSKATTSTQTHAKTRGDAEAIADAGATADVTDGVTQADATTGASVSVGSTVN